MDLPPPSDDLDIGKLAGLFRDTTASYKYFFFLAVLRRAEQNVIVLQELAADMVLDAWFPSAFCRLSFGPQDSLADEVQRIDWGPVRGGWLSSRGPEWERLRAVAKAQVDSGLLMRFVPYRLLRPFFAAETRGLPDQEVNLRIAQLSRDGEKTHRPLYRFNLGGTTISLIQSWQAYLTQNRPILEAWTKFHLADFLQRKNPSVPGILEKLVPPEERASLAFQTSCWREVQGRIDLVCPYSQRPLSEKFSLDHIIPWSFVAHDRLWNLVPVSPSANSSKGDRLPRKELMDRAVELQFQGLTTLWEARGPGKVWDRISEAFLEDLRLPRDRLLDKDSFVSSLGGTLSTLADLAARQGFPAGWKL